MRFAYVVEAIHWAGLENLLFQVAGLVAERWAKILSGTINFRGRQPSDFLRLRVPALCRLGNQKVHPSSCNSVERLDIFLAASRRLQKVVELLDLARQNDLMAPAEWVGRCEI